MLLLVTFAWLLGTKYTIILNLVLQGEDESRNLLTNSMASSVTPLCDIDHLWPPLVGRVGKGEIKNPPVSPHQSLESEMFTGQDFAAD